MITAFKGGINEFNKNCDWIKRCIKSKLVEGIILHHPGQHDYFISWCSQEERAQGAAILIHNLEDQHYVLKNIFFDFDHSQFGFNFMDEFNLFIQERTSFYKDLYLKLHEILTTVESNQPRELVLDLHGEDLSDCMLIGNWRCEGGDMISPQHYRYKMDISTAGKESYLRYLSQLQDSSSYLSASEQDLH